MEDLGIIESNQDQVSLKQNGLTFPKRSTTTKRKGNELDKTRYEMDIKGIFAVFIEQIKTRNDQKTGQTSFNRRIEPACHPHSQSSAIWNKKSKLTWIKMSG